MKITNYMIMIICLLFLTACTTNNSNKIISNGKKINTNKMSHKHCTRKATAESGIDVSLNYDVYYTGENINIIHSEEKVISSNNESLDLYEDAYKKIHANYKDLTYYDTEIVRGDTTVTSSITINYDKIDIEQLLKIEGEKDNIIENKKAKLNKWLEFAKKFGTTCEDV